MRDPARIDRILARLRAYWVTHPDLRLGQIVVNAIPSVSTSSHVFYAEDDVVESGIPEVDPPPVVPHSQLEWERGFTDGLQGHSPSMLSQSYLRGYSHGHERREELAPWEDKT